MRSSHPEGRIYFCIPADSISIVKMWHNNCERTVIYNYMTRHTILIYSIALMLTLFASHSASAAFHTRQYLSAPIADTPYKGERIYREETHGNYEPRMYVPTKKGRYSHPYVNHEHEATLSLIFGILGIYVFPLFAIPAFVLGIIAADKRNRFYRRAVTGLVLGAIPIAILVIVLIVLLLLGTL